MTTGSVRVGSSAPRAVASSARIQARAGVSERASMATFPARSGEPFTYASAASVELRELAAPMNQCGRGAAPVNRLDPANDDRVRMALKHFLDHAIDAGERAPQQRRAGDKRHPFAAREPRRAFDACPACKAIGEFVVGRARILTPNVLLIRSAGKVDDVNAMQTINEGGSSDSEHSEVAVQPVRCSPRPVVTKATPLANSLIARRKASPSRSDVAPLICFVLAASVEVST